MGLRRFETASKAEPELLQVERPTRPADLVADLVVPLAQAGVTGALLAGLLTFLVIEVIPDYDVDKLRFWTFWTLLLGTFVWLLLLVDTRSLLRVVERVTRRDLDGDGEIGQPQKQQERVVIVNAPEEQEAMGQRRNAERASQFARFVAQIPVRGTDTRTWEGEMGRSMYQEYRDALIRLGWAEWNSLQEDGTPNEKRGWSLVVPAGEILRLVSG